jgi:hypothetical protein
MSAQSKPASTQTIQTPARASRRRRRARGRRHGAGRRRCRASMRRFPPSPR